MAAKRNVVKDFDLFVGGKIGTFKGISIDIEHEKSIPISKNIQNLKILKKNDDEITTLAWGDPDEIDVLIGLSGQKVKIYDTDFKAYTSFIDVRCGKGSIRGLSRYNGLLLTAVESGHVKLWTHRKGEKKVLKTGSTLEKMRHSSFNREIIATGGKDNDLKLWDIEQQICTFEAKNVKPNMLQLMIPKWVSDMDFLPNSSKVAVCTRHGHVRLYDPSTPQRRPVVNFDFPEQCFTSLALPPRDNQVIAGTGRGKMFHLDFRMKRGVVHNYKGATGSVKSLACHKTEPYVVSVGLDRHLRIHNIINRILMRKIYLKSRLSCVLLRSDAFSKVNNTRVIEDDSELVDMETMNDRDDDDDVQFLEDDSDLVTNNISDNDDDLHDLANVKTITGPSPRKKLKTK